MSFNTGAALLDAIVLAVVRNRRYYQITPTGRAQLAGYRAEWDAYTAKIDRLFEGETQ